MKIYKTRIQNIRVDICLYEQNRTESRAEYGQERQKEEEKKKKKRFFFSLSVFNNFFL